VQHNLVVGAPIEYQMLHEGNEDVVAYNAVMSSDPPISAVFNAHPVHPAIFDHNCYTHNGGVQWQFYGGEEPGQRYVDTKDWRAMGFDQGSLTVASEDFNPNELRLDTSTRASAMGITCF